MSYLLRFNGGDTVIVVAWAKKKGKEPIVDHRLSKTSENEMKISVRLVK